ncbi:Nucleoside-diphosphate-sugar epimerase [Pseudomonas delhiensis]|uniref:Nucleoside-diphosphate-sugar epimerase n=1 Tax=Pseudomonas delhiensis TaxID=366289 RepID=A0A239MQB9_9PSED|nr:SDR family oxidoreductase [Pseudomonas delhiensis]SDI00213.1 Nucleoside-diphosphate-sugar epimerase [Pseudomonas delhiensis]SNT44314.1 Nucleoside-diphosphate-sugar epimerase [Pseudomonas delhiensis]
MKVLLTGATGFVGRGVLEAFAAIPELRLAVAVRSRLPGEFPGVEVHSIDGLSATQDWSGALAGVDVVVHAAARVHVMCETADDPLAEFRAVNVEGTLNLARQAAAAGVRRFIFISSVKVNGESTPPGRPFRAEDAPAPADPYGQSKLEAERALSRLAEDCAMEWVVIRPPLIYGPGVGANFASLMRAVQRQLPLPFARVRNRRSLVARDNLVDLLRVCLGHERAANQVFLVSDDQDLSSAELCRRLAAALGVRSRLLPVPVALLQGLAALFGRGAQAQRVLGSLQVDIGKTRELLGWRPPVGVDQALAATARWYRESRR